MAVVVKLLVTWQFWMPNKDIFKYKLSLSVSLFQPYFQSLQVGFAYNTLTTTNVHTQALVMMLVTAVNCLTVLCKLF